MKRTLLALTLLAASSSFALGQALPAASRPGDLQAGGTFTYSYPDYTPQKAVGFGLYASYDFGHHLGLELDYRQVAIQQHSPAMERTFEYDLRYSRYYGRYQPYIRGGLGRGSFNFPTDNPYVPGQSAADLSYNMYNVGGGVDFRATQRINIRAEIDYQSWFAAPGLQNGLTPALINVGAAYHFGSGSTR